MNQASSFHPFIGSNYEISKDRILVIGESHYCSAKENCCFNNNSEIKCNDFTQNILNKYINYKKGKVKHEKWMNTFTKFSNVIFGKKLSKSETIIFFKELSFYNYLQYPMPGPRIAPSEIQFLSSYNFFLKTVESLKPRIIFFWGYRLWNNIPKKNIEINELLNNINTINGIPIIVIPHPSTKYYNYKYHEILKQKLTVANTV